MKIEGEAAKNQARDERGPSKADLEVSEMETKGET